MTDERDKWYILVYIYALLPILHKRNKVKLMMIFVFASWAPWSYRSGTTTAVTPRSATSK